MRITRREALAGAGAAWLALRGARASAMPPDPSIPATMGRGIDLTPQGTRAPGSPQDYTVLRAQPWAAPLIARTTHLRLWVDWTFVQPRGDLALGDPANPGAPVLASIDAQVDAAVADGLQVILIPWRYPRWVNHNAERDGHEVARVAAAGLRPRPVQPVGDLRGGAVGSLRRAGWRASR